MYPAENAVHSALMETSITVAEAARTLPEVIDRACHRGEATTVVDNGKPVARIVPADCEMKTGPEIAAWLTGKRPRLGVEEAEAFEADLLKARAELRESVSPWD